MITTANNFLSDIEQEYFSLLIKDREDNARVSKKRSMRGVWRGIIDKYPDSAHFLYELLQNADDANASMIHIRLEDDGLLFKHNGKVKFSITNPQTEDTDNKIGHINSITSVGASTKETGDNKIGKFGVGFKAVFQYTQTPHIYDDLFRFGLNDYIVPFAIEDDHFWRNEGETLFWLPFDRHDVSQEIAYNEIKHKLSLLDNPILFLRNLSEIEWQSTDNNGGYYRKHVKRRLNIQDVACEEVEITNNDERSLLWLFTQEIEIESQNFHISAGLYLDSETNSIITDTPSRVYCFFPTKEKINHLPFIIHAPFELVDSRQNIKNNDVNREIVNSLAELCSQSLICLRDISEQTGVSYLNESVLEIVPLKAESRWENEDITNNTTFYNSFKAILSTERLIFSQSKKYLYAEDSYVTNPVNLKELFDNKRLNSLLESEEKDFAFTGYSSSQSDKWKYIEAIGVNVISTSYFVSLINEEFMTAQSVEWLHKFYRFFNDDAKEFWNIDPKSQRLTYPLRQKPIIRLSDGTYTSVDNGNRDINVFYPTTGVRFKCNFIDLNLLDTKSTADFFKALGVKEPDAKDYIINVVLPQYTKDEVEIDDDEIRSHLKTIYEYSQKCPYDERKPFIKKISESLYVVGKKQNNKESHLFKINELYEDSELLMKYFSYSKSHDIPFLYSNPLAELN